MAQAVDTLNNLIREGKVHRMADNGTKKHRLIRALLGMKHSPAGKKHLAKKKTQSVYFKGVKRKSDAQRFIDAGLTKEDLRSLGIKQ